MLVIGLTGGIGSGKSLAANLFLELGIPIIDADKIAHALCQPGESGYQLILAHFGTSILDSNGHINRRKLRDIAFDNDTERQWLESTLHPMIRREMRRLTENTSAPYHILVIPLLTETNNFDGIDRTLVIDCAEELQIARACNRDSATLEQVQKILNAQNSRQERLSYADDVIINDESIEHLKEQVSQLHELYLKLSLRA